MAEDVHTHPEAAEERPWVRRTWCVWLAVGIVMLGAVLNTIYLFNHCPIDLTGDEAHYWEWSRHLDYGYYSKPPGIAWVIWLTLRAGAALGLTGDGSGAALMPVMRMAAVIFGTASGLLSLALARRVFRDDRAALAVTVLSAAVPMFAVGSLLITIDSPMYLCWAGTVGCMWKFVSGQWSVVSGQRRGVRWLYGAGIFCAVGMLFKPVLIAIPVCLAIGAWADGGIRRAMKTWHVVGALAVMMCSQIPVVIWNAHHNWVTFRHILAQGGMGQLATEAKSRGVLQGVVLDPLSRLAEYLGGQAGGMGGILFVLLVIAVGVAWGKVRGRRGEVGKSETKGDTHDTTRTGWVFLLSLTLPLWVFYLVMNLWKRTELNWPAASYFTAMILLAGAFVEGWTSAETKVRKPWRVWGTIAIVWGVLMTSVAMNLQRFYPLAARKLAPLAGTDAYFKSAWHPGRWDRPMALKVRGLEDRARQVEEVCRRMMQETGQEPLVVSGRYDTSSSLSFYMTGHPFVYCIMSSVGGRQNQYDFWPGLNEGAEGGRTSVGPGYAFAGRPAVIVGPIDDWAVDEVLRKAFDRVEGPEEIPTTVEGIALRKTPVYRAYGFRGLPESKGDNY